MPGDWRLIGDTTLDVYRSEFARLGSPMLADVEEVYAAAKPHSALALAMSYMEQKYSTLSSIGAEYHNPLSLRGYGGAWARFYSWAACVAAWKDRITSPTYGGGVYAKTRTLPELIHIYAPASDHNDEARYVQVVEERIAAYKAMAEETSPVTTPTTYDLATDYARFGLTKAEANEILTHRFTNRRDTDAGLTGKPAFIVLHIQDGTTPGSLKYWTGVQASATVLAQKDGSLLTVIPEAHGPWTNGDVQNPTARAEEILSFGGNPNAWTLSLEAEGKPYEVHPDAQLDAIEWQCRDWMARYKIPTSRILRHGWINSVTRANCPGAYFDMIIARLGVDDAARYYPEGIDLDLAAKWFGSVKGDDGKTYRYDETGPLSKLWLSLGGASGAYPALVKVEHFDARTYFTFSNGLRIWRPNDAATLRVLKAA